MGNARRRRVAAEIIALLRDGPRSCLELGLVIGDPAAAQDAIAYLSDRQVVGLALLPNAPPLPPVESDDEARGRA